MASRKGRVAAGIPACRRGRRPCRPEKAYLVLVHTRISIRIGLRKVFSAELGHRRALASSQRVCGYKIQKSHFFVSRKQKVFQLSVTFGIAMNIFGKWTGCRERMTHINPMSSLSPISFGELNQRPSRHRWTHSGNSQPRVCGCNAFLTPFNASVTKFNGLCNARFSKINVH